MEKNSRISLIQKYKELTQNVQQEKISILSKLKQQGYLTIDDHINESSNLCIILSCPGEQELLEDKVCAGQTGENLEKILKIVTKKIKAIKPAYQDGDGQKRYCYTIINSSNIVHFREYNNAEPTDAEILCKDNLLRIEKELSNMHFKYCIICGDKANLLFENLNIACEKSVHVCHIGNVGLRNTYRCKYSIGTGKTIESLPENQRDNKRIDLVACEIIDAFK